MNTLAALILIVSQTAQSSSTTAAAPEPEKIIVYQKETSVNLEGSTVDGELKLPPAFFLSKTNSLPVESLLDQKLNFKMKNHSRLNY